MLYNKSNYHSIPSPRQTTSAPYKAFHLSHSHTLSHLYSFQKLFPQIRHRKKMPMLSPPSFKSVLVSTTVLSAAIALKLSAPTLTEFAVYELPSIYYNVVSWLKPPYLYLVINGIIITILASSKLSKKNDDVSSPEPLSPILQQPVLAVKTVETGDYVEPDFKYDGVVLSDSVPYDVKEEEEKVPEFGTALFGGSVEDEMMSNKENEFVVGKSTWNSMEKKDSTEYSQKPSVAKRFGHRRSVRASPEGGKTVLGVSKPKRQDTLESTWKTITEGRAMPLTRHLRKSDTWERDGRSNHHRQVEKTPPKIMMKSETFNDRTNTRSPSPGSSNGGSGKMRKEPSLSHDELNRRVEAFINKFNEDMRLQRQESLNQYKEMINRGSP